ncbi:MAG: trimethylamine corrinoid protein 2 [Firmicutes bacterium]|nr:trimethylamine corrinoid protein 2 [Bacillota bacterium]
MLYKADWELIEKRYIEYWEKENHDRPLISVCAPKEGYIPKEIKAPEKLVDRWMDIEYLIQNARERFSATYFGGEAFPNFCPNLGPDILGAILGWCDLEFGDNTSWAVHKLHNWEQIEKFEFDPMNKWWKKIVEITEEAVKDSRGDYFVSLTDLHSGVDALVSLRGPENLCLDLMDYPGRVKKATFEVFEVFKQVYNRLYNITLKNLPGSSNWMGVWHPEKWYPTSCDFICLISKGMFDEFVLPELLEEIYWLDASIFHLDGPGALKHLDALLDIPELKGIQWVYGAGQPSASHWIPVLKKIQDAGKLVHVSIEPHELDILITELRPEGVMYTTWCKSEQDAEDLLKKAERSYKKRIY